jgi:single-strand DNA-binding protein
MPSVNKVVLIGNLTRDPQTKQLPNQTLVTEFGLAMNRKFKGGDGEEREEVCFVDCAAFGRQAEVIQKYCRKGKQVYVEGRLKYDSWDDKNGHGKRSKLSVVVETFQFLGPVEHEGEQNGNGSPRGSWKGANLPSRKGTDQPFGDGMEFKEADIPF